MDDRALLQQALEKLEFFAHMKGASEDTARLITALRERLAQPEQEPVATDWERIARVQDAKLRAMCNEAGGFEKLCEVMDKYEQTTPPQRTWAGLTDEEVDEIEEATWDEDHKSWGIHDFARAIEAKLKERNT